jgi:capsule biosynthesis phosphatase
MLDEGAPFAALRLHERDFHVLGTPAQVEAFCVGHAEVPKLRFCFDLDHTLVTAPQLAGDYSTCLPIPENIALAQALHRQGHHIIICTARRMRTHKGNPNAVVADVGLTTLEQLRKYHIPHDEVSFGKPWAQFYIDDLAIDALGDVCKQAGFYFPTETKAGAHAKLGGTSAIFTVEQLSYAPLVGSFVAGAACALGLVALLSARK